MRFWYIVECEDAETEFEEEVSAEGYECPERKLQGGMLAFMISGKGREVILLGKVLFCEEVGATGHRNHCRDCRLQNWRNRVKHTTGIISFEMIFGRGISSR